MVEPVLGISERVSKDRVQPQARDADVSLVDQFVEAREAERTRPLGPGRIAVPLIWIVAETIGRYGIANAEIGKHAHPRMLGDPAEIEDLQRQVDLGILRL